MRSLHRRRWEAKPALTASELFRSRGFELGISEITVKGNWSWGMRRTRTYSPTWCVWPQNPHRTRVERLGSTGRPEKLGFARDPRHQEWLGALRALSRQPIRSLDWNGFLSKQTAPAAFAFASRSGSARAVITMNGNSESRDASNCMRSNPLMPGIWTSVMTQMQDRSPFPETNSSAEANPRAP